MLHIHLLGGFRLFLEDGPIVPIEPPRQQALLAYLLLHRHSTQSRQQMAFAFWPDSSERQAYTNLRKLFFQLRQVWPEIDFFLTASPHHLSWRNDALFTLDIAALEQVLEQIEGGTTATAEMAKRAIKLFRGEVLPSCYDDWILPIRRALHGRVVNTLTNVLNALEAQHEYPVAISLAEHLLHLDPLHETAYRHLMKLRALSGDRAGADCRLIAAGGRASFLLWPSPLVYGNSGHR